MQALKDATKNADSNAATQAEIKNLEKELKRLDKKSRQGQKSLKSWTQTQLDRFDINGYWSTGVAMGSNNAELGPTGYDEKPNFRADSIVAIQLNFHLSEIDELVVQLVAPGLNRFEVNAEWAYLSHKATDDLTLRAGRLRMPYYFMSETIDIGFTYPWVRPPLEIYVANQPTLEGADLLYKYQAFGWSHLLQVIGGTSDFKYEPFEAFDPVFGTVSIKLDDNRILIEEEYSINTSSAYNDWTVRLGYSHMYFTNTYRVFLGNTLINELDVDQRGEYYNAAVQFDDGDWISILEFGLFNAKVVGPIQDNKAGYYMLGHRFGRWLPHLTVGKSYSVNDPEATQPQPKPPITQQNSYSLGARYDYSAKIALKWQIDRFNHFADTKGVFGNDAVVGDAVTLYSFVIDSVF
jgi:hypothetical protein